jgi:hypothetical protein
MSLIRLIEKFSPELAGQGHGCFGLAILKHGNAAPGKVCVAPRGSKAK